MKNFKNAPILVLRAGHSFRLTLYKNQIYAYDFCLTNFISKGCPIKKFTNVLLYSAKKINPRVKKQARCQNNRSRALKWDIVHFCILKGLRDMIKNKICNFLEFLHFSQFSIVISAYFYKNAKFEKLKFL